MSEAPKKEHELMLMAYLDGELGAEDRARVKSLIESNSDDARLVENWVESGELIRSMPKFHLDEGFTDRVLAAIEAGDATDSQVITRNQQETATPSEPGSENEHHWQMGAAAIATLAAMLLLTLFVFPNMGHQSSVAIGGNPEIVVETSKDNGTQSKTNSGETELKIGQPIGNAIGNPGDGPSKPLLNKNLAGGIDSRTPGARDLVPPFRVPGQSDSVEQVLWVDMKSRSTALSDIEAVLLKNSMTILRNNLNEADQTHLVQGSNSRFEVLHVIAIRSQVKKAIGELSNQHEATFQVLTLPTSPTHFPLNIEQRISAYSGDAGPDGDVQHNSRLSGSPKAVKRAPRPATVQQLHPNELIAKKRDPNKTAGDPAQTPDAAEMRYLDEWFGLSEKEDEASFVRLLLLIDTSPRDSDPTEEIRSSDD